MSAEQSLSESIPSDELAEDSVRCKGFCDRQVHESATVDVAVGARVGEWQNPKPHVGISAIEGDTPVIEQWCTSCAKEQFGIEKSAYQTRMEQVTRYITPHTVAAFFFGVILTLVLSSYFII